ncbi:SRPBCC domain-containing protein [Methylomonas sp. MK1]|uniref:SRPBCC domain-containing protein n=1 Tax=Methylomonas sp. MK1 TaxID=1131552 RepID=UPI00037FBF56|nr:SRPBCC domain-containing protein [Methylomonas sp. MK1]
MIDQSGIQWPEHYHPQNCPVHVRNALDMAAQPERVWAWLVRAPLWPSWYVNSANLRILENAGTELKPGTRFRWKTFGVTITSTVLEYVPNERLAWDAKGIGVDAYHAWLLRPSAKGCDVLTEETQHGWLARLGQLFLPKRMSKYHQIWLESLQEKALSGLPGGD